MHNRAMRDASRGRVLFLCCLVLSFALMLSLNAQTPLMMDDYDYSFSWSTGERLSGLGDILRSQAAHYRLWGGRSVVHALAQLFLYWGKPVFNVVNAAMYVLLLLELLSLAGRRKQPHSAALLLAAQTELLVFVPFFATVFLWLDGACNYLFGTVLALLPLLIAKSEREGGFFDGGWRRGALALPLCFLAGWTNENTACGVLAVMGLLLLLDMRRGKSVRAWRVAALGAELAGVMLMLLAPGNFARPSAEVSRGLFAQLLYRALVVTWCLIRYAGVPLVCAALLFFLGRRRGIAMRGERAALLALCALLSAYALVASPQISDRSFTAVTVLALSAALTLLDDWLARSVKGLAPAMALMLSVCFVSGAVAMRDTAAHEAAWTAQLSCIETAAQAGETEVAVSGIPARSRFTMDIVLADSPGEWPNSTLSRYFGIAVHGE